jgi:hypothetical protein
LVAGGVGVGLAVAVKADGAGATRVGGLGGVGGVAATGGSVVASVGVLDGVGGGVVATVGGVAAAPGTGRRGSLAVGSGGSGDRSNSFEGAIGSNVGVDVIGISTGTGGPLSPRVSAITAITANMMLPTTAIRRLAVGARDGLVAGGSGGAGVSERLEYEIGSTSAVDVGSACGTDTEPRAPTACWSCGDTGSVAV